MSSKKLMVVVGVSLVAFVSWAAAQEKKAADNQPSERSVVVPEGMQGFKVSQQEFVRLTASVPSGGQLKADIKGPARLIRTNSIRRVVDGQNLIGSLESEFEIRPTAKGKVEVTISKKGPVPNSDPETESYSFTVE
jgi:hypothetical protein